MQKQEENKISCALPSKAHVPAQKSCIISEGLNNAYSLIFYLFLDFYIEQIFLGCLANYSYYVESNGEALVIDPISDIDVYMDLLESRKAKLKYILETHFHADFVSGHLALSKATNAIIVFGPNSNTKLNIYRAQDKEYLPLGNINMEVLHSPGHTLESTCYLLRDSKANQHSIFTGDTLFINEVGRPDLACNEILKPADLATMLYKSIKYHIDPLPDNVIIFPGHGAGSPCGKSIGKGDTSTIGEQRKTNFVLNPNLSLEQFITLSTSDLPKPLGYMSYDVMVNKGEIETSNLESILERKLNFSEFKNVLERDPEILIIDSRKNIEDFIVQSALFIGFNSNLSIFLGSLVSPQRKLLLISDDEEVTKECLQRFLRIGYDNIVGYLAGGIKEWINNNGGISKIDKIEPQNFKSIYDEKRGSIIILDVRNKQEYAENSLINSIHVPLIDLERKIMNKELEFIKDKEIFIHCRGGPRGFIGQSILLKNGFGNIKSIIGGLMKMIESGFDLKTDIKK